MAMNPHMLAALLAEKAKNQQAPALNNPMAKPMNTMQVNPLAVPMAAAPVMPMAPVAASVPTPGFKPPRFAQLANKLKVRRG